MSHGSFATEPHLGTGTLLDYWLGDSDGAATDAADEHLMQCDACGRALDELLALGQGIRDAWRAGLVGCVVGAAFVRHLAAQGLQVREYRVAPGGSVNCTVAPGDELLVSRLALPPHRPEGLRRLDLHVEDSLAPGVRHELSDIPFDPQAGEVLVMAKVADIRPRPAHRVQMTLRTGAGAGARELGRYVFNHRPWTGGA